MVNVKGKMVFPPWGHVVGGKMSKGSPVALGSLDRDTVWAMHVVVSEKMMEGL